MLIKIDKDRFINSDHIVIMYPPTEEEVGVKLITNDIIHIPTTVATYITQVLDANDAYTEEKPTELSLESQIAQFLRDQAAGQSFEHIHRNFPDREGVSLHAALKTLTAYNVIHKVGDTDASLYYHASNPIIAGPSDGF